MVRRFNYKPHMVHLRQRLAKFVREKRGDIPQRDFARKIGVAQSTIMRIENQDQNVTIKTLEQLCEAFHIDVQGLFPVLRSSKTYPAPEQEARLIHEDKPEDDLGGKKS